ncbi:CHAT domain-containing protein [Phyllosticta citrichinensis]|uniref:CHAT domain-containing protein n=1 Tax=Phyllosticta citrichinensis TaxID=1130410 RepID=A0ABR1Y5U3_9PEZI
MTNSDIAAVYASRLADLNEAIAYFQQSLAAGDSTRRNWGNQAFGVAFLLLYGAELTGDNSPIPHTMKLLVMSVENDGEAPLSRVSTASRILRYLWSDIEGVVELQDRLAKIAIDLLPYACSRELSREDQQYAIRVTEGFAADSFSFSIKLGNVEEALQRVEYSRGLIMGHLIDRKDNFTNLKKKHIDLAKKYLDLRDRAFHPIVEEKLSGKWESVIEEQRKAHLKLRDCEEEIRRQPGFENFQKLTSLEELQGSATHGPIVVVNVTSLGSDAIILTKSQLATIPLPKMTKDIPQLFQGALGRYVSGTRTSNTAIDGPDFFPFDEPVGGRNSSTKSWPRLSRPIEKCLGGPSNAELLTWLWKSSVRPVILKLQELGISPNTSGDLPRVWWIGSGAASSLPFHAAGDFETLRNLEPDRHEAFWKSSSTCLDWMTPSYAPTMKALRYARARANAADLGERPAVMVVTMPSTPGQSELTGVLREKAAVEAAATDFQVKSLPDRPAANVVLASLPGSPKNDGGKLMPDKLTVGHILDNTAPDGSENWLVYLSACSTAQVKADKMGDESLHLASAFQVAGFAHAIGSLWSADDDICVEVARLFYQVLSKYTGTERKVAVAHALRKAVIQIRDQHYDKPALWAPFIHFGA